MFQIGSGMIAAFPATIMTAMVSPTARPMPRMMAAAMPESAAGTRTRLMVCQRVAPMASDPSLYSWGTELMASSETLTIVGSAMMPRRTEAASQVSPVGRSNATRIKLVRTMRPKNPYTTEGIPASSSMAGLRIFFIRGEASSEI